MTHRKKTPDENKTPHTQQYYKALAAYFCILWSNIDDCRFVFLMPLDMHSLQSQEIQRGLSLALLAQSPIVTWIQDNSGRLVFVNEAHKKIMGTTREHLGRSVFDIFPEEIAREYRQNDEWVLKTRSTLTAIEKVVDMHGVKATYKVTKFPLFIDGGWMVGGFAVDISDREAQYDNQLQHERAKAKLVVNSIIEAQESERQHLSQVLRDGISQTLTSCKLMMEVGDHATNPHRLRAYNYIQAAIKELGAISATLSGSVISDVGLLPAINHLLAGDHPDLKFKSDLQDSAFVQLSDKLQLGLYRIMQSVSQLALHYPVRPNGTVRLLLQNKNLYVLVELWQKKDWVKLLKERAFRNINNQADYLDGTVSFDEADLLLILPVTQL